MPTRVTESSATVIDHIFCNFLPEDVYLLKSAILTWDLADHLGTVLILGVNKTVDFNRRPLIRIYSEKNINSFINELSQIHWDKVYFSSNVNNSYNEFSELFKGLYNKHFPLTRQSRKACKNKIWVNRELKNDINYKNKLYKTWIVHKNPADKVAYDAYAKGLRVRL